MHWLLETDVFSADYRERMTAAVEAAGHTAVVWDDDWWGDGREGQGLPELAGPVLFHGSLGNAARIVGSCRRWQPGAYCDVEAFRCSAWYPRARRWLLQERHELLPACELVTTAAGVGERLGTDRVFVRPDSPLKPFSGRVLPLDGVTLEALDHGFYFDDETLPVVVAPARWVGREWRFVVVDRRVVAGSAYVAEGRAAVASAVERPVRAFAELLAAELNPPQRVYVLDVCETDDGLRLMELNPFSGADLYACDLDAVVAAVGRAVPGRPA